MSPIQYLAGKADLKFNEGDTAGEKKQLSYLVILNVLFLLFEGKRNKYFIFSKKERGKAFFLCFLFVFYDQIFLIFLMRQREGRLEKALLMSFLFSSEKDTWKQLLMSFLFFSEKEGGKTRKDRGGRDKKIEAESSDEEDNNLPGKNRKTTLLFSSFMKLKKRFSYQLTT